MKTFLKKLFVTGFFIGYFPLIPGTVGTILGAFIFLLLNPFPYIYYPFVIIIILLGVRYSSWAEDYFKSKDPKQVVIDEIAGMLITMTGFSMKSILPFTFQNYKLLILGFIFFRAFDVIKPYPARRFEKLKGGWGIMLDDIIAGIYATILLHLLQSLQFLIAL